MTGQHILAWRPGTTSDLHGELIERRAIRHAQTDKHHDDPARIVALLPECTVSIDHRMGDRSRRRLAESLGIQPVLTVATNPHQAVKAYLKEPGEWLLWQRNDPSGTIAWWLAPSCSRS